VTTENRSNPASYCNTD